MLENDAPRRLTQRGRRAMGGKRLARPRGGSAALGSPTEPCGGLRSPASSAELVRPARSPAETPEEPRNPTGPCGATRSLAEPCAEVRGPGGRAGCGNGRHGRTRACLARSGSWPSVPPAIPHYPAGGERRQLRQQRLHERGRGRAELGEWPERLPKDFLAVSRSTLTSNISGTGSSAKSVELFMRFGRVFDQSRRTPDNHRLMPDQVRPKARRNSQMHDQIWREKVQPSSVDLRTSFVVV